MSSFAIYELDIDFESVYTGDGMPESWDPRSDRWATQLIRKAPTSVDLWVSPADERIMWTFWATPDGQRFNSYLCDYRSLPDSSTDILEGLRRSLIELREEEGWQFVTDFGEIVNAYPVEKTDPQWEALWEDTRWRAGFDLEDEIPASCPGLTDRQIDALVYVVQDSDDQIVLGMRSYRDALSTVKHLFERRVDATVAVNTFGATENTADVDLVLWPGAPMNFAPTTAATKRLLGEEGFWDEEDAVELVKDGPQKDYTDVGSDDESTGPLPSFVGDILGRIGAALLLFVGTATAASLVGSSALLHPVSGLAGIGGIAGATAGLYTTQAVSNLSLSRTDADDAPADDDTGDVSADSNDPTSERESADDATPVDDGPSSESQETTVRNDGGSMQSDDAVRRRSDARESSESSTPGLFDRASWQWEQYTAYFGFSLLLGYAFPTIFRLFDWWPNGEPPIYLAPAATQAGVYVGGLLGVSLLGYALWTIQSDSGFDLWTLASLVALFASFGAGLVLGDGLACLYWYDAIGFEGTCG